MQAPYGTSGTTVLYGAGPAHTASTMLRVSSHVHVHVGMSATYQMHADVCAKQACATVMLMVLACGCACLRVCMRLWLERNRMLAREEGVCMHAGVQTV